MKKYFSDYKKDAHNWITLSSGEFYPDILKDACELYKPVLVLFGRLVKSSESSVSLFLKIADIKEGWMRIQLARVFRKYVSPDTPVEMLKKKTKAKDICDQFGKYFRPVHKVQAAYASRSIPDEALCAILWEYRTRGEKGYNLTEKFFNLCRRQLPEFQILGHERAGRDIRMEEIFEDYPNKNRPVDFVICDKKTNKPLAIGLARYDSDRGGAQEDDRTGGYHNCVSEILSYCKKRRMKMKVIFVNDGPGLLLGSMWDDYSKLEKRWPNKILVTTLRMIPERLTKEWLKKG